MIWWPIQTPNVIYECLKKGNPTQGMVISTGMPWFETQPCLMQGLRDAAQNAQWSSVKLRVKNPKKSAKPKLPNQIPTKILQRRFFQLKFSQANDNIDVISTSHMACIQSTPGLGQSTWISEILWKSKIKSPKIEWTTMNYHTTMKYNEEPVNKYHELPLTITNDPEIAWATMICHELPWNSMTYHELRTLTCHELPGNTMNHHEIPWKMLWNTARLVFFPSSWRLRSSTNQKMWWLLT